jgi:hypothetical protein
MTMDRRDFLRTTAAMTLTLAVEPTWAQTAKAEVLFLGQATTKITTLTGMVIVIDPFLVNNPKTPQEYRNLDKLGKVDVILITHGHGDHVGTLGRTDGSSDAADLAKRTGAKVLGPAGLIQTMLDLDWVQNRGFASPRAESSLRLARRSRSPRCGPSTRRRSPWPIRRPRRRGPIPAASRRASSWSSRTASSFTTWATPDSSVI